MFSKISTCIRDWINRSEPPLDHQQSACSINDQLDALSLPPENDTKVYTNKDDSHNGSNAGERENGEDLQDGKNEISEGVNLIQNEKGDKNEGRIENEKESEVVREAEQVRNWEARIPVRPEAEDCSFRFQTGSCKFGMNCKSNHPPNGKHQVGKVNGKEQSLDIAAREAKEKDDSKAKRIDCENFDHRGDCNSGKASEFNRSRKISPAAELNFMGLPIRLGEKDCPYYMRHGSCKFGVNCWFNHPDPTSVVEPDSQSGHNIEGSIVSPYVSQSTLGSSSPAALGENSPFFPFMFPSTLGSSSPAALNQSPSYLPTMFPSTQGVPFQPEWQAYQAPVYLPGRSVQPAPAYATNSQPLEKNVYIHQQHQILVDEFPERRGQPECSFFLKAGNCRYGSACKFHHPKNPVVISTSSTPLRPAVQPLIPEAVVSPGCDASFNKKCIGQCSVSNVHKRKPKQPRANPKNKSANPNVKCDLCKVECPSIHLYEEHLSGKKHTNNLQKLHASRTTSPAEKASQSISKRCSAGKVGTPSGEGMEEVTSVVTNLESKRKKSSGASEVCAPSGKGTSEVTSVVTDLETNIQKSCSANEMGTLSGRDKAGITSVETDLETKKQKSGSAGETSPPSGEDTAGLTDVVTDLEKKKHKLMNGGIPVQSLRVCTLCNVVCNGERAFADHMAGKKHLTQKSRSPGEMGPPSGKGRAAVPSLVNHLETEREKSNSAGEMGTPSGKGGAGVTSVVTDLETKKQKLLEGGTAVQPLRISTGSNVACNGEIAENMAGKKHLPQEQAFVTIADADPTSATNSGPESNEEIIEKINNQSASCEACKISCTISEDVNYGKQEKKEKNNTKSQNQETDSACPASTTQFKDFEDVETRKQKGQPSTMADQNPTSATIPKPKTNEEATKKSNHAQPARCELCKVSCTSFEDLKHHKQGKKHKTNVEKSRKNPKTDPTFPASTASPLPSAQSLEDLEAKKRKVLECGAPADAVRICTICNVVCNSETVFNSHLAGQKHATVVKQKQLEMAVSDQ